MSTAKKLRRVKRLETRSEALVTQKRVNKAIAKLKRMESAQKKRDAAAKRVVKARDSESIRIYTENKAASKKRAEKRAQLKRQGELVGRLIGSSTLDIQAKELGIFTDVYDVKRGDLVVKVKYEDLPRKKRAKANHKAYNAKKAAEALKQAA